VTETNPPPHGSERAAARLRAASSVADKPGPKSPPGRSALEKTPLASKASLQGPPQKAAAVGPGAIMSERTAPAAQRSRSVAPTVENPSKTAAERQANGTAAPPLARATARARTPDDSPARRSAPAPDASLARGSVAYSREPGRSVPGAGEPYPPLSERVVNGIGTSPMDSKRTDSKRITPRSPRTALDPDTVDMPLRRSKSARHPLVIIGNAVISLFVLLAIVVGFVLFAGKQRFEAPGPLAEDRIVNLPRGSGIRDIADVLMREGVIDQPWVFIGGVLVLKAREDLKAGEYQFKAHASLRDVVATIVDGNVVAHHFNIPEGLTSEQIVARLLDDDVLTGNIKEIPREGSLLPDTYNYTRGVTREQMIQRMQQAQQRLVKEVWDRRSPDLPIKTPEQLVVLASLVEKETGKPEERTRVAAVFVNRLKQKMRLQSDPTIIYGLVGGKGTLGRPIMKSEIEQPTPYNTYQIDGLPPGPISNPGRASLEAAANPARTRELYFVADGTGGHAFAETYEQHQKNVARLRSIETDQKDQAPADGQPTAPRAQAAPAAPAGRTPPPKRAQTAH
jgi:UPF0755 protein